MQYRSGWGDTIKNMTKEVSTIVSNLVANYPGAKQADEQRAFEQQQKDEAFQQISSALGDIFGAAGIKIRQPSKAESLEDYIKYTDSVLHDHIGSLPNELRGPETQRLYDLAKSRGMEQTQEVAGRFGMRNQLGEDLNRFAPQQNQQLPEASPVPSLGELQGQFGPAADPSTQVGNALLGPPPQGGPMAGLGLDFPSGMSTESHMMRSGGTPSIIDQMASGGQMQQPEPNRFAQGRTGPDYTKGFEDDLRRLADDVSSNRVNYRDAGKRRDDILGGLRKGQLANEEHDEKMRNDRLNALRKDLFAARGRNKILRRDTREEIAEWDSAEMWDNPENFILGEAISAGVDPLKQYDAETRRIAANSRGAGGRGGRGSDNQKEPQNPFAKEILDIDNAKARLYQDSNTPNPVELRRLERRRGEVGLAEREHNRLKDSTRPLSVEEAKTAAVATFRTIDALKRLIQRNSTPTFNDAGVPSFRMRASEDNGQEFFNSIKSSDVFRSLDRDTQNIIERYLQEGSVWDVLQELEERAQVERTYNTPAMWDFAGKRWKEL